MPASDRQARAKRLQIEPEIEPRLRRQPAPGQQFQLLRAHGIGAFSEAVPPVGAAEVAHRPHDPALGILDRVPLDHEQEERLLHDVFTVGRRNAPAAGQRPDAGSEMLEELTERTILHGLLPPVSRRGRNFVPSDNCRSLLRQHRRRWRAAVASSGGATKSLATPLAQDTTSGPWQSRLYLAWLDAMVSREAPRSRVNRAGRRRGRGPGWRGRRGRIFRER